MRAGVGNHGRCVEEDRKLERFKSRVLSYSSLLLRLNSRPLTCITNTFLVSEQMLTFPSHHRPCETERSRKFCRRLLERNSSLSSCRFDARPIFVPGSACVGLVSECRNKRNWGGGEN